MKYFKDCKTLEEVKKRYRRLAKEHHPDMGGDKATMQAISAEYAFATALLLQGANLNSDEAERELRFSEEYRQVIDQIINLPSITIELVGLWIWVTGDTKPVKEQLSDAGLHFAWKKEAWYYRSAYLKMRRGGKKTLEEIRAKFGSEKIRSTPGGRNRRRYLKS